jgi:hypothetical protein
MFCPHCGAEAGHAANFCSTCGTRLPQKPTSSIQARDPQASPLSEPDSEQVSHSAEPPHPVRVLDAGDKLLITGVQAQDVELAIKQFVQKGSKLIAPLCQIGKTWTAACSIPPTTQSMDEIGSQSLELSGQSDVGTGTSNEPDDGCRIVEMGFKRIVYGASPLAVKLRLEYMQQFGARAISDIEEVDGEWTVICDVSGADYRW